MWGWIVAAFILGGVFGAIVMSCLAANAKSENNKE